MTQPTQLERFNEHIKPDAGPLDADVNTSSHSFEDVMVIEDGHTMT